MPLVSATNDDDFIAEVTEVTAEAEERQRRHTAAMIEEYLRRRTLAAEEAAQAANAEEAARWQVERSTLEAAHAATRADLANATRRLSEVASSIAAASARAALQRAYGQWCVFVARRRGQHQIVAALAEKQRLRQRCQAYLQWRLLATARRAQKLEKARTNAALRAQGEQQRMLEQLHDRLREEEKRNERLEADLKTAFLKGVSALNREAVQVLRGEDGARDAEEIEDILSGSRRSANISPTSQSQHSQLPPPPHASSAALPDSVCPVHYRDPAGTYYHPCYAPCSCPHYPRNRSGGRGGGTAHVAGCPHRGQTTTGPVASVDTSIESSHSSSQHTPFVVRADPSVARTVDTDYPHRLGEKPRWR